MNFYKKLIRKITNKTFAFWQALGFHVTPVHFYEPIPDTRLLQDSLFTNPSRLVGINMQDENQKSLVATFGNQYKEEYGALPNNFLQNNEFGPVDAELLYCMIRSNKPKRIIEVGSGYSTLIAIAAITKNASEGFACQLASIDPYPKIFIQQQSRNFFTLIKKEVQEVSLKEFESLSENDILFIDSSHMLKIGSDVQYEYLEILPRLKKGVVAHIHDIFFPYEYPRRWVMKERRFFNEQYLLQAFLAFNRHFEILCSASYLHEKYPELLSLAFDSYNPQNNLPGSF